MSKGKSMADDDYQTIDLRDPNEDLSTLPKGRQGLSADLCEQLDAATVNDLIKSKVVRNSHMKVKVKKMLKQAFTL